ncbi:DAK2 domain-containing protein [Chloroflexota bacterium]
MKSSQKPIVSEISSCDGQDLKNMFNAATRQIERNAQLLNSLNVFPVPDGDTGTNMLLTMRAAMKEANDCSEHSAEAVAQSMAKGALMGARGNSGVILSQILRGLAGGLQGKYSFNSNELADALAEASLTAYKGVSKPVEGTILTVIREASAAAQTRASCNNSDLLSLMEALVEEAKSSVAKTPSLLPVLRQAGVVDAGGQGLYLVFEGALSCLRGDSEESDYTETIPVSISTEAAQRFGEEVWFGYCTEFLLQGSSLEPETIREKLAGMGESVLVVGDDSTIRVHLHTSDPDAALSYATSLGTLRQIKVDNMEDQHQDFIAALETNHMANISLLTVVSGEGLARVSYSIGAKRVIPGGETMNPSVKELLEAVEAVSPSKVILLPNNPNILLAASQVQSLTKKRVEVVPTVTIPQGIAALLTFNSELDLETNVAAMEAARLLVRSGEVTTAMRSMEIGSFVVQKGQAIAFLDGKLVAVASSIPQVVSELLTRMNVEDGELVTIYYGADISSIDAEEIGKAIHSNYPGQEVEVISGGQPHYNYIISVE